MSELMTRGMARRLLELHTEVSGRCRVCSSGAQTGNYVFPCAIRLMALERQELGDGTTSGTRSTDREPDVPL